MTTVRDQYCKTNFAVTDNTANDKFSATNLLLSLQNPLGSSLKASFRCCFNYLRLHKLNILQCKSQVVQIFYCFALPVISILLT